MSPPVQCLEPSHAIDQIVVVNDDAVASGGAASIALTSIALLRKRGLPVTLLSGGGMVDKNLEALGVDVVSLGGSHILEGSRLSASLRGLYDSSVHGRLASWVRANDTPATIYHLHNWHKVLSPAALSALAEVQSRLFLTAHDFFLACPNGGYFHYGREKTCALTPMSGACLMTSCDKRHYAHKLWRVARHGVRAHLFDLTTTKATILAVHDGMVPLLQQAGVPGSSIKVLRNPVTPWRLERVPAETNREVLYVGRLERDKGIDVLLHAAKQVGARLRVVGDGPLLETLRARHPEAIFMGRLDRDGISQLCVHARFVVVPTRVRETFGLVALEGLMSGLPLITSSSALIADEVLNLGIGLACPPGDIAALAASLTTLMGDDEIIATMSTRGFNRAHTLAPTPDDWCSSLLALYRQKLAGSRGVRKPLSDGAKSPF